MKNFLIAVVVLLLLAGGAAYAGFRTVAGMAGALASGAIDLVGMARPLAIEPELPARLLQGLEALHPVHRRKTGIKAIDRIALMEVAWYTRQLQRMAAGKDPVPEESPLVSFAANMFGSGVKIAKTRLRA